MDVGKAEEPLKIGDIQKEDGIEWYISGVVHQNGKPKYSRVRVGSLAHSFLVTRDSKNLEENKE